MYTAINSNYYYAQQAMKMHLVKVHTQGNAAGERYALLDYTQDPSRLVCDEEGKVLLFWDQSEASNAAYSIGGDRRDHLCFMVVKRYISAPMDVEEEEDYLCERACARHDSRCEEW